MPRRRRGIFGNDFLVALRTLVDQHHKIYPLLPPQGIYFEALVQEAFNKIRKPYKIVEGARPNQPGHDILVEGVKLSVKTETGAGTDPEHIHITKLCTTEKEPWAPGILLRRVVEHLRRYDAILMLRAVWEPPMIHYQLLEIPVPLLTLVKSAKLEPVGRRKGRQSLGANVTDKGEVVFHVHFDGSDGKCQIRNLAVPRCVTLLRWDLKVGS